MTKIILCICYEVLCLVDRTNELLNGMTINISDGGLCLKLAVPLMTRQTLHIETIHPIIACRTASVQWVSRNQDGSYLRGLTCLFE
jgi:hypothetical protein